MNDDADDDFERNVAEMRHCAQVRSTGEDSICIRLCDRILAAYRDLKAQYDSAYAAAMTNADALTDAVAERDALRVRLADALIAMRNWGAQEDGIPGGDIGAWQSYRNGAVLLGWCIDPAYAVGDAE